MICPKCNKSLPVDSEFCQYCGNKIDRVKSKSISDKELYVNEIKSTYSSETITNLIDNNKPITESINKEEKEISNSNKNRYCKKCGNLIDLKTKKCSSCGKQYIKFNSAKILITAFAFVILVIGIYSLVTNFYIIPMNKYKEAITLLNDE